MKFPLKPLDLLHEPAIRAALNEAWKESHPGLAGGHEEGGFITLENEKLSVRRWPKGRKQFDSGAESFGMRDRRTANRGDVSHASEHGFGFFARAGRNGQARRERRCKFERLALHRRVCDCERNGLFNNAKRRGARD